MLGLTFFSKLVGALTLSLLLQLPPRKMQSWFVLWSFFLLRLPCISINLLYNHTWNTVFTSGLVLLAAAWNCWISYKNGYAGSLAASLEPLADCENAASLSRFYRYYFARCSSELTELVLLPYSQGRSTR